MSWNQVEGYWIQLLGRLREQWGVYTHQRLDIVNGQRAQVVGRLQRIYGSAEINADAVRPLYGSPSDVP